MRVLRLDVFTFSLYSEFADAGEIFAGPMAVNADTREDYGEDRWIGIGDFRGRIVIVVFTEPRPGITRIISVRKALRYEREYYEQTLKDEFGLA